MRDRLARKLKHITASVIIALLPFNFVSAAIELDDASYLQGEAGTTVTVSHDTGAEDNMMMVVIAVCDGSVSAVTHNGDALTKGPEADSGGNKTSIWYRAAPDVGTANVVVTKTNGVACDVAVRTYNNARQTIGGSNFTASSGTTPSIAVTVQGDAGIVVDGAWSGSPALTVHASQTQIFNDPDAGSGSRAHAGSFEAHSGSNVTMSWSMSSDSWAIAALEIVEEDAADESGDGASMMMGMAF